MSNTTLFFTTRVLADVGLAIDESIDHAVVPGEDHSAGSQHRKGEAQVIFFLLGSLFLGGIFRKINKMTGIPYALMLFIVGVALGYYNAGLGVFGQSIYIISIINPSDVIVILLPALIFESGFNADRRIFKRQSIQILLFAIPYAGVSAIFIAFCIKIVFGYTDEYYTWLTAFVLGAILSCTDNTTTRTLLKEARASEKVSSLIEVESIINSSTCMVLLTVVSQLINGLTVAAEETSVITATAILRFFELMTGGVILGTVFGALFAILSRVVFNDEVLIVNISLIACYLVYYVAENVDLGIQVSGMFALVTLGLFMAKYGKARINAESEHTAHTFWKHVVYCAETIIFLMAGIIIGIKVLLSDKGPDTLPIMRGDFFKLPGLYICMTLCRFLAIIVFMPILKRQGYGLTWKEVN